MTYKLFIDDEREPVGNGWLTARSSESAWLAVAVYGMPKFISFDHDLGGDDTSMRFLHRLAVHCMDNNKSFTFGYTVHSQNPVGRDNIIGFIESFKRHIK